MIGRLAARWRAVVSSEPVTVGLLVAANLVPLIGVLFFNWDVFSVLFLYWLENGIVGMLNVPRIVLAARNPASGESVGSAIGRSVFFVFHYGVFWLVHGVFVFVLTGGTLHAGVLLAAIALLSSNLANFWLNYVGQREYLRTTPSVQQFQPYGRLIVLHLTIVIGGIAIQVLGQPAALIALLVLGKTLLDLGLHFAERSRLRRNRTAEVVVRG